MVVLLANGSVHHSFHTMDSRGGDSGEGDSDGGNGVNGSDVEYGGVGVGLGLGVGGGGIGFNGGDDEYFMKRYLSCQI